MLLLIYLKRCTRPPRAKEKQDKLSPFPSLLPPLLLLLLSALLLLSCLENRSLLFPHWNARVRSMIRRPMKVCPCSPSLSFSYTSTEIYTFVVGLKDGVLGGDGRLFWCERGEYLILSLVRASDLTTCSEAAHDRFSASDEAPATLIQKFRAIYFPFSVAPGKGTPSSPPHFLC